MKKNLLDMLLKLHPVSFELKKYNRKMQSAIDLNLETTESAIEVARTKWEEFKKKENSKYDNTFNVIIYSALANSDMLILSTAIMTTNRKFEKLLFSRMLALILIEYLSDINSLLGKSFKELKGGVFDESVNEIKVIGKKLAAIKNANESLLRVLRNETAAHKSKDSLDLVNQIYKIDCRSMCDLSVNVTNINNELFIAMGSVFILINQAEKNKQH